MPKETREPLFRGISKTFLISKKDCQRRQIKPILANMEPAEWCILPKLAKHSVGESTRPYNSTAIYKDILKFFYDVKVSYNNNLNLLNHVSEVVTYLKAGDVKAALFSDLQAEISRANAIDLLNKSETERKQTRSVSVALEKEIVAKAAEKELGRELARDESFDSNSTESFDQDNSDLTEHDNLHFDSTEKSDSIATRLKQEAVRLHGIYKSDRDMDSLDIHRMACGLSSILDLTCDSQKSLFTNEEWSGLKVDCNRLKVATASIENKLISNWGLCSRFAVIDGNVYRAMVFAAGVRVNAPSLNIPLFKKMLVFETLLMTVQNEAHLLNILANGSTKEMETVSEEDIYSKLWSPLLNGIINVNNRLRIKSGETKTAISTLEKSALYYNDSKVEGFKIDFRIIYDYNGREIDLCSGETSKGVSGKPKIYHDDSKLAREGKDLLDNLYDLNGNVEDPALHAWTIQLSGCQCQISTQHLYSNGLYTSVPRFKLEYPQSISDLSLFIHLYTGLSSAILDMENLSRRIEQDIFIASTSKPSLSNVLHMDIPGSPSSVPCPGSGIDILSHRRPTWYTPPCKDRTKSVIPSHLFGRKRFSSSSDSSSTSSPNTIATSTASPVVENDKIVADHFGFYRFGAGYKNIYTGDTIYDYLPHEPRH